MTIAAPTLTGTRRSAQTEPARAHVVALTAGDVLDLVERSREALLEACHCTNAAERYHNAHLAALRACAAVLAMYAPRSVRSRPRNAWETLTATVPEFCEWAAFFQLAARRSRAGLAGIVHIDPREADDLVRQSELFLGLALTKLGLPEMPAVAQSMSPVSVYARTSNKAAQTVRGRQP